MLAQYRWGYALMLVAVLIGVVGCASTTTTPVTAEYVDDARIAADVSAKLVADPTLNASRVHVTSSNGVVYLAGSVPTSDRLSRASDLARQVHGVRSVVNNMVVASAPATIATVPAPPARVVVSPAPTINIVSGHPPVDATGVIAHYDPQSGILTLQDGRMFRITSEALGSPSTAAALQPGAQIMLRNVYPVSYQPTTVPVSGSWRLGTVSQVDAANRLVFLTDGTVVHVAPSTTLRSGTQTITLAQLQPGSQLAISLPTTTAVTVTPTPAPGATVYSGSALPRQVVPLETPEVRIFVVPR